VERVEMTRARRGLWKGGGSGGDKAWGVEG
jgi:hypothetical protein